MTTKEAIETQLITIFCDESNDIRTYEGIIGQLNARKDFEKILTMGSENHTVFAVHPHVIEVRFCYSNDPMHGESKKFTCPCQQRRARSA